MGILEDGRRQQQRQKGKCHAQSHVMAYGTKGAEVAAVHTGNLPVGFACLPQGGWICSPRGGHILIGALGWVIAAGLGWIGPWPRASFSAFR